MHKSHEKTKIYRKFKQDKKLEENNDNNLETNTESLTHKIEKYEKIQKMIEDYDKRQGVEKTEVNPNQRQKQVKNIL